MSHLKRLVRYKEEKGILEKLNSHGKWDENAVENARCKV